MPPISSAPIPSARWKWRTAPSTIAPNKDAATPGEAKNSWLTGTAAWTFLALSQGFCGIKPDYAGLRIEPCIPTDWDGFTATRVFRGTTYQITVRKEKGQPSGKPKLTVDGKTIDGSVVPMAKAGRTVQVAVQL